ncbi:MAG: PQQ-binding-like beta-propeller repeat protein [Planctomycetota bacterium]
MTDERIRALERSVANAPGDATMRLSLARELARAGRRDDARGHLAGVLRAEPLSADAVRMLDDLGFEPLAHDAPWPTPDGQNDRARRSAHPGARRGELVKRIRIGRDGETASSMTVGAATVYVASSSQRLIALDVATGSPRWIRDFQTLLGAPVIGEGERLFVVADGKPQLLDGARGETLWSARYTDEPAHTLFAPRGLALVVSGDLIHALDVTSGAVKWRFKTSGALHACPVADGSAIFVAGARGAVEALGFDGKVISRVRVPQGAVGDLMLLGDALVMSCRRDPDERMTFLVARDGCKLGKKTPLTGLVALACAVDASRFLAGGPGSVIYSARGESVPVDDDGWTSSTISDSGSCIFGQSMRGLLWGDSTGSLVKTIFPGAHDTTAMAIGPDSTLLVASPRGILHVIA